MKALEHPFARYGAALTLLKTGKEKEEEILKEDLIYMLQLNLEKYRLHPVKEEGDSFTFDYLAASELASNDWLIQSAGLSAKGFFLAPHALTIEKNARQLFGAQKRLLETLKNGDEKSLLKNTNVTMSIAPVTGKINQGKSTQSNPKAALFSASLCAVTNLTDLKPALSANLAPTAIIPDLAIDPLKTFIYFFERMLNDNTKDLKKATRKEGSEKIPRPKMFSGNFPFAPRSHAFGAAALLGAIGQWSKEVEYSDVGLEVLESLKNVPLYIISYDKTEVVSFDHYIVELAKEAKLSSIISGLEASILLSEENKYGKGGVNPKYQLFWKMTNRFLQLFDKASFKDFLAFRAEYQPEAKHLLNKYFMAKENIKPAIVDSARELGRWLNLAAYIAASNQFKERKKHEPQSPQDRLDVRKYKSKFLLEAESAAFSAKSPEALLHQVIRRAGQLSFMDAPSEAQDFMDAVCSGEITIDQAKNLLLAYSRLKNIKEKRKPEEEADDYLAGEGLNEVIN